MNERKFEFAFDLVLGANDPGLYADLLNGAEVNSGVLITPNGLVGKVIEILLPENS